MKVTRHQAETILQGTEWECKKGRDLSIRLDQREQIAIVRCLMDWNQSDKFTEERDNDHINVRRFIDTILSNW